MSSPNYTLLKLIVLSMVLLASLAGCATGTSKHATSVVEYLYPNTTDPIVQPSIPVLRLPLRVGIAFVPGNGGGTYGRSNPFQDGAVSFVLSEAKKAELMNVVTEHFRHYDFIKDIQQIPSSELVARGSFANLDQIRGRYGVDVIALLSYDQVQFTDEGIASLTYWTLIGGFLIPAEKNDTHTLLDAAVYDIASRKMLFRAPGNSHIKSSAIPAALSAGLRQDSEQGFQQAAQDMIVNLDTQLARFRQRVKEDPAQFRVVR